MLEPIKLAAFYCLAHRHFLAGIGCFVAAKLIGFATGAYLFDLCQPQLLKLRVFARLYATLTHWRALAEDLIAPYRAALRTRLEPLCNALGLFAHGSTKSFAARLRARSRSWVAQKT